MVKKRQKEKNSDYWDYNVGFKESPKTLKEILKRMKKELEYDIGV